MDIDEIEKDAAAADRSALLHPACVQCKQECCALDEDGQPHCNHDCDADFGEPVYDETFEVAGYVHKACRDALILDNLRIEIELALQVRAPLGLQPWIAERSRNLAQRLFFAFDVDLLKQKGK